MLKTGTVQRMQFTTTYSRGEVVLVPFPWTDLAGRSKRPAVVVSSDAYNQATNDMILAQITGRVNTPPRTGDHMIAAWQQAGLQAPSRVRAKVVTLNRSIVVRSLGRMPQTDMHAIESNLRLALQL